MAHAQKPDFVFRRNRRVHLNRRGRQFSRLLAAEVCASAVVMLDTPCSEVVRRVLATHSIRQFSLQFPSHASPCAITFQLESNISCSRVVTGDNNGWSFPSRHPIHFLNFLMLKHSSTFSAWSMQSRNVSVLLDCRKIMVQFFERAKGILLLRTAQTVLGTQTASYPMWKVKCSLRHEAAGAYSWPFTSIKGRGQKWIELYLHFSNTSR